MRVRVSTIEARSILTRTSGYLKTVSSHSLQPYVGCSFGQSLCGVGCYVQHNIFVTKDKPWGGFLVAKTNAAELYSAHADRERRWAHRRGGDFCVFMSSATDPFVPHDRQFRITEEGFQILLSHLQLAATIQLIFLYHHVEVELLIERFAGASSHD